MADSALEAATVEVVYATPDEQRIVTLEHRPGLTARAAVDASGLVEAFPEIAERPLVLGLYAQPIDPDRLLSPGDRVEICRPLLRDPRTLRRELLKHGLVMGPAARRSAAD
jgi:putative ubiquitin-RnfH superfamily antitoxin RatB of RatAB toxin-antitoxin module